MNKPDRIWRTCGWRRNAVQPPAEHFGRHCEASAARLSLASGTVIAFPRSGWGLEDSPPATRRHQLPHRRCGAIMVVVMVCLVLATLMLASLLRVAVVQRRQVQREEARVQARWLVESGLSRAAGRLAAEADYTGETWVVSADELTGQGEGEVRIRVSRRGDEEPARTVRVDAVYPTGAAVFASDSKEIVIHSAPQPPSGDAAASTTGDDA